MIFHEFGNIKNPSILCMHGMMQDWNSEYELLKPLEKYYRLIIPAMDGFYDGSPDFSSFADQSSQIEEYIQREHNGELFGAYGASQGGLMLTEILSRDRIKIDTVIMDGVYVAHQGRIAGWLTYKMFCKYKNTGKFPVLINLMMKLMGTNKDDMLGGMEKTLYLRASDNTIKRNFIENYTYHTRPSIAATSAKVYLWCGSKEPYAIKSHKILKKYLKNYEEEIMPGFGHGEFLLFHQEEICQKIHDTLSRKMIL